MGTQHGFVPALAMLLLFCLFVLLLWVSHDMHPWIRYCGVVCALAWIVGQVGCGGEPVGTVQGKVTYRQAPVATGSVIFQNADGTVAMSANLNADGTYQVKSADRDGLPPGQYKVAISPGVIGSGEVVLATMPGQAPVGPPPVPAKYHSPENSGLSATVAAGTNPPFNFELTD